MFKITIDGTTHEVEDQVFRRILVCARHNLRECQKVDGRDSPTIDRKAVKQIDVLQATHIHLI